jgi:hypothetical protein
MLEPSIQQPFQAFNKGISTYWPTGSRVLSEKPVKQYQYCRQLSKISPELTTAHAPIGECAACISDLSDVSRRSSA